MNKRSLQSISRQQTILADLFKSVRREYDQRRVAARFAANASFSQWAAAGGFIVDREPFSLDIWRYLRPIYEAIPEDGTGWDMTIMKSAQGGASTLGLLQSIWQSLRARVQVGYFLPTEAMATLFSTTRFLRLVRANHEIHRALRGTVHTTSGRAIAEGSASVRRLGESIIHFTHTSGLISTEALPLDALILDEVQEMLLVDIQKVEERLSASHLRAILRVSTPNFAGGDIHHFYERSDQREFHTRCACPDGLVLSDAWDPHDGPLCIDRGNGTSPAVPTDYFFYCPTCGQLIVDPQDGQFVAHNPGADTLGFHFSQLLSPRQSPATIIRKWERRVDTKAFFNRILGRPYTDPKTQPVSLSHLERAQRPDLRWGPLDTGDTARVVMGIDQGGHENHVVIKADDGHRVRLLWLEVVQDEDPWRRCYELMRQFNVRMCVVEALPNYNEAHRFAREFGDRGFVAWYQELADEPVAWRSEDGVRKRSARHTVDGARSEHAVAIDQHRMMSRSLGLWTEGQMQTPDARSRIQTLHTSSGLRSVSLCSDVYWLHLRSVALVTESIEGREDERRYRRSVRKIGIDPHFAFANMLADVGLIRDDRDSGILLLDGVDGPGERSRTPEMQQILDAFPFIGDVSRPDLICGTCHYRDVEKNWCRLRLFQVQPHQPMCPEYIPLLEEDG